MTNPIRTTSDVKFSHALTGPYLPTPGKVPGWPFQEMGRWKIDADAAADEWVTLFGAFTAKANPAGVAAAQRS